MRSRENNFTLIELLIVIAIITILVAMLLPALNKAREKAKQAICRSNLKQDGLALFSYANDYNSYLPVTTDSACSQLDFVNALPENSSNAAVVGPGEVLWQYLGKNGRPLFCPSNPSRGYDIYKSYFNYAGHIRGAGTDTLWTGYAYCGRNQDPHLKKADGTLYPFLPYIRKQTSADVLMADFTRSFVANANAADAKYLVSGEYWDFANNSHITNSIYPVGGNVLYYDGHATWIPFSNMSRRVRAYYENYSYWW